MTWRLANHDFTLSHGGNTVRLRPSLRAASQIERMHDGFQNLFQRVEEFDLSTITKIIIASATDRRDAEAFLSAIATEPLKIMVDCARQPIIDLCIALIPAKDDSKANTDGKTVAWSDFYADLFGKATGWLGWTPEAAWNATPAEIEHAFVAKVAHLRAIHGAADDEDKQPDIYTPAQLAKVEADGLDSSFDRNALNALKANIRGGA